MIRRSLGTDRWILISQVEHARLSGELAAAWGNDLCAPLTPYDEMVGAIAHHDDGWSAWEVAPKVDPQSGWPLEFTETPLTDSLAIWRESISRAAHFGSLAAYMVSGHFSALLERFSGRWHADAALERLAKSFLDEQCGQREQWLGKWGASSTNDDKKAAAAQAVAWLQMFDAVSLWLCCGERDKNEVFNLPSGDTITLNPKGGPYDIEVAPWPFGQRVIQLQVAGRAMPIARYANSSDLVTASVEPSVLNWSFRPCN